jgi:DNA-binding SARP family transcriptional activator/predicted ATPase
MRQLVVTGVAENQRTAALHLRANMTQTQAATISVQLLRPFAVSVNGQAMSAASWRLRHPRQLFQMLCMRAGHRMHRDEIVECLWPQSDVQASANRLYHTIHVLRAEFARMGLPGSQPAVLFHGGTLWLNSHHRFEIDAWQLAALVTACRDAGDSDTTDPLLEQAAHLCEEPLPEGAFQDAWFETHRKELRDNGVWVLERLGRRLRALGRNEEALRVLQRLVDLEPSNEIAHRGLMELFDAAHQPERAILQYSACQRYLQRDLAAMPSQTTSALRDAIVGRLQAKPVPAAPSRVEVRRSPYRPPDNAHSALLGRAAELAELQSWFADPRCRLVTIAAPAGTGKTSVARALAHEAQDRYADGVLVVRLTQLEDPAKLEQCILESAGHLFGLAEPAQFLREHLAGKHMLLVLDRFEHLVEEAVRVSRLIEAAPGVQVLVTSQCHLNCQAERVFVLRQLAEVSPSAALELFVQTARASGASADQLADTRPIEALCARLGGNALAITLAAAQLATRSMRQLSEEIVRTLSLAAESMGNGELQHRSLRAAIGWSLSLVGMPTRKVLHGLAVFQGSFSFDDALAVLGPVFGAVPTRQALLELIERYLVCRDAPAGGSDRAASFLILDSIRQISLEHTSEFAEWQAVQLSHATLFRERTHQTYELERLGQSAKAFALLAPSEKNVEQALDWQLAQGDVESYLQWCAQACTLQLTHGRVRRAIERLRLAIRLPVQSSAERRHSAMCGFTLSRALLSVHDLPGSVQAIRMARQRSTGSADELLVEKIGTQLCVVRIAQMSVRAATLHIEALVQRRQSAYAPWGSPSLLSVHSGVLLIRGEMRGALGAAESALDAALNKHNRTDILLANQQLLSVTLRHGLLDRARTHAADCQAIENFGYGGVSHLYRQFLYFFLNFESEDHEAARRCLSSVRELAAAAQLPWDREIALGSELVAAETGGVTELPTLQDARDPFGGAFVYLYIQAHCHRVRLQAQRGEHVEALASLAAALTLLRRSRNRLWVSWLAGSLAGMAADRAEHHIARHLLLQAEQLQLEAGIMPTPRQRTNWHSVRELLADAPETESVPTTQGVSLLTRIDMLEGWARSELCPPSNKRERRPKRAAPEALITAQA